MKGFVYSLMIPFKSHYYYNPIQCGSASIKKVLPSLTNLSYSELEISNGGEALEKYCELDTLAEVEILKKLKDLI